MEKACGWKRREIPSLPARTPSLIPGSVLRGAYRSRLDVNTFHAYIVGMESMQYTIRGILPWMDERLRAKAKKERKSLNAVAVEILMRGLNPDNPEPEYHDMDDLIGTWVHDPDTDEALASMDTIDEELWR